MTFTIPDPATHVGTYLAAAVVVVGLVLAGRVRIIRALLSGTLLVALTLLLVVALDQRAGVDPHIARWTDLLTPGRQQVVGTETRVPLARDGHFWVKATLDGVARPMMIDSGATATTLSQRTAERVGLQLSEGWVPILIHTANGTVRARTGTVRELRLGNIVARDLMVVVAPGIGDMDVVGMNFLSRLKGWSASRMRYWCSRRTIRSQERRRRAERPASAPSLTVIRRRSCGLPPDLVIPLSRDGQTHLDRAHRAAEVGGALICFSATGSVITPVLETCTHPMRQDM